LMPALYSAGEPQKGLRISILWAVMTWALAIVLASTGMGFAGMAVAYTGGTGLALFLIAIQLKSIGRVQLLRPVFGSIVNGVVLFLLLRLVGSLFVRGPFSLVVSAVLALGLGLAVNIWPHRRSVQSTLKAVRVAPLYSEGKAVLRTQI